MKIENSDCTCQISDVDTFFDNYYPFLTKIKEKKIRLN